MTINGMNVIDVLANTRADALRDQSVKLLTVKVDGLRKDKNFTVLIDGGRIGTDMELSRSKRQTMRDLRKLQALTEESLIAAYKHRDEMKTDPINWGDLHCVNTERVLDLSGEPTYRVFIEEASHDCSDLPAFVRTYLDKRGWKGVEVITEW